MKSPVVFLGEKREHPFGGWTRTVQVGNEKFSLTVQRGKSVRIPYKPRGQNKGWQWNGTVYQIDTNRPGYVWSGRVNGSIGCRGLLTEAGILAETVS